MKALSLMIPKLYFLYLTPPLGLELWASEVRHYLEISAKCSELCSSYIQEGMNSTISADESTKSSDSFLYLTPSLGLELWSPEVTGDYLEIRSQAILVDTDVGHN